MLLYPVSVRYFKALFTDARLVVCPETPGLYAWLAMDTGLLNRGRGPETPREKNGKC